MPKKTTAMMVMPKGMKNMTGATGKGDKGKGGGKSAGGGKKSC